MLLLIDAGNTRVKWALANDGPGTDGLGLWSASGSVMREQVPLLESAWCNGGITRALMTNVAGPELENELERMLPHDGSTGQKVAAQRFVSLPALAGVRNGYRQPQQLGCDRFAAAIGGHALFPERALVIVTCGTATTIDGVTADGIFTGGMILPGLNLMASSLARQTAQLPQLQPLQESERLPSFADNTEEAILSGCIAAQAGAIERAYAAWTRVRPDEPTQCILSGGAAGSIASHLAIPCVHVDNLVLIGLQAASNYLP